MTNYNTDWFKKRMKESHPYDYRDYILLSKYKDSHTKVKMFHTKCKSEILITPNSFISGRGCRKCGMKRGANKQKKSYKEVRSIVPSYIDFDYQKFISVSKPMEFHCNKCNSTYMSTVHAFEKTPYCTHCHNTNKNQDINDFKRQLKSLVGNEYSVLEYNGNKDYAYIRHNICGYEYPVTPHNFKRGKRCPKCNESHGERIIARVLNSLSIKYETQKKFDDLYVEKRLSYDFYLPEYKMLIEYQGEQHYYPVIHFGGMIKFRKQQNHDNKKRIYAKEHGYKLLLIPYTVNTYSGVMNNIKKCINTCN